MILRMEVVKRAVSQVMDGLVAPILAWSIVKQVVPSWLSVMTNIRSVFFRIRPVMPSVGSASANLGAPVGFPGETSASNPRLVAIVLRVQSERFVWKRIRKTFVRRRLAWC